MNILGVDFGTKRIGLAWVQKELGVVLPYGIIEEGARSREDQLVELISEEKIDLMIIGLPLGLEDGTENANTKRVRVFVDSLKKRLTVPVEFIDERLSSWEADEMGGNVSRDEKAAMVILGSYIESVE